MKDRLRAMRRVLAVQSQARRLAEWQLAAAEARVREIERAGRELDGFIDGGAISGDLAVLALNGRRRLAARQAEAAIECALDAEGMREARSREKLAERRVEKIEAVVRQEREKLELERAIEAFTNRRS